MPGSLVPHRVFRRLLVRAIVVPALLSVALGGVLVWQIIRLLDGTQAVEHSNRVIAEANQLEKLHIDLETGMRGYLLRGDALFLEPYERALGQMEVELAALRQLISGQPAQQERLIRIDGLRAQWLGFARTVMKLRDEQADWQSQVTAGTGKRITDQIRAQFAEFIATEETLRSARIEQARNSTRVVIGLTIGIALALGGLLALLSVQQLRFLGRNYETALAASARFAAELEQRVAARTQELAATVAALAEANRELEAFAYSISHDLRAPMRHIAGFADLLRRSLGPGLKPDDAENLATIHDTAKFAGRMVDDLLGFSRLGRTQLGAAEVDLAELVAQCRLALAPEIGKREIRWQVHPLPPAHGDRTLLKLVLQNLLANAVKYTGPRAVAEIEVGARAEGGGTAYWVRDNGVGFDPAYAHKLFGVFQRLHRAEEFEGTGIGLANVRRIVLRHGGRVWAEGRLGAGAAFYFWLPKESAFKPNAGSNHP